MWDRRRKRVSKGGTPGLNRVKAGWGVKVKSRGGGEWS